MPKLARLRLGMIRFDDGKLDAPHARQILHETFVESGRALLVIASIRGHGADESQACSRLGAACDEILAKWTGAARLVGSKVTVRRGIRKQQRLDDETCVAAEVMELAFDMGDAEGDALPVDIRLHRVD